MAARAILYASIEQAGCARRSNVLMVESFLKFVRQFLMRVKILSLVERTKVEEILWEVPVGT